MKNNSPQQQRKRVRLRRVFLFAGAIILFVAVTAVFFRIIVAVPGVQKALVEQVQREASRRLGCVVTIGSIQSDIWSFMRFRSVVASGISLNVSAEAVTVRYILPGVIKGRLDIRTLVFTGVIVDVVRDKNGDLSPLFPGMATVESTPPPPHKNLPVAIHTIRINHGTIGYFDSLRMTGFTLNDAELVMRPISADSAAVKVACSSGSVRSPVYRGVFTRVDFRGDISSSCIRLDEAIACVPGLRVTMSGRIPFKPDVAWDAAVSATDTGNVLAMVCRRVPELEEIGPTSLRVRLKGGAEDPDFFGTLQTSAVRWRGVQADTAALTLGRSGDSVGFDLDIRSRQYGVLSGSGAIMVDSPLRDPRVSGYRADLRLADAMVRPWIGRLGVGTQDVADYGAEGSVRIVGTTLDALPDSASVAVSLTPRDTVAGADTPLSCKATLRARQWEGSIQSGANTAAASGHITPGFEVDGMYRVTLGSPGDVCAVFAPARLYADMKGMAGCNGRFTWNRDEGVASLMSIDAVVHRRLVTVDTLRAMVEYRDRRFFLVKGNLAASGSAGDVPFLSVVPRKVSGLFAINATGSGELPRIRAKGALSWHGAKLDTTVLADSLTTAFVYDGVADTLALNRLMAQRQKTEIRADIGIILSPFSVHGRLIDAHNGGGGTVAMHRTPGTPDSIGGSVVVDSLRLSGITDWFAIHADSSLDGRLNGRVLIGGTTGNPFLRSSGYMAEPRFRGVTFHRLRIDSLYLRDSAITGSVVLNISRDDADLGATFLFPLDHAHRSPGEPAPIPARCAIVCNGMRIEQVVPLLPGRMRQVGVQGSCDGSLALERDGDGGWGMNGSVSIRCDTVSGDSSGSVRAWNLIATCAVNGTANNPHVVITASVDSIMHKDHHVGPTRLAAHVTRDRADIDSMVLVSGTGRMRISGAIGYVFKPHLLELSLPIRLGYSMRGVDVRVFEGVYPVLKSMGGVMDGDGLAIIDSNTIRLDGGLDVTATTIAFDRIEPPLGPFDFSGSFHGDSISIIAMKGVWGRGVFDGHGSLVLSRNRLARADFDLTGKNLAFTYGAAKELEGRIESAQLHLGNNDSILVLGGTVVAGRSSYKKNIPVIGRLVRYLTRGQSGRGDVGGPSRSPVDNLALNVRLNAPSVVSIDLGIATATMETDALLCGTLLSPGFTGVVKVNEGTLEYLGRKFIITRGTFRQMDCLRLNPDLDLSAEAVIFPTGLQSATKYKVTMELTGTLELPDVILSAVSMNQKPEPLSQVDIISLLMIGRIRNNSSEVLRFENQTDFTEMLSERAQAVASQEITGYAARQIERLLNLDNVSFDGNIFNARESRVTVTKNIRDRLSVSYQGKIGNENDQNVRISYKLTPVLYVDGEADVQGKHGLDLRFRWTF